MYHPTVIFGVVAALCWGSADFLSRRQSMRVGTYKTALYTHVLTLAAIAVFIPFLGFSLELVPSAILVLTASGLLNFLAFISLYRAYNRGNVSVVAPIAYTYPVVTTVLSVALLGTTLGATSVVAIACIVIGVATLSAKLSSLRAALAGSGGARFTAGTSSAIASSVLFGVVYVGLGYSVPLVGYVLPVLFLRGIAAAAGFLFAPVLKQEVRPTRAAVSNTIIAMGVLEAVGFLSISYGISLGGSSLPVVTAVSGMGGAVAAACGLVLLRERLEMNQIVGVVLALAGVFTLLYIGG